MATVISPWHFDSGMDLEQSVLERIVPSPEEVESIDKRAQRLKDLVLDYVANHGIDVEVRFAGSFSKGTFLSNPDLDLFLMFPDTVSREDMQRIGLQAGEDILHGIRMFSEHPYTRGVFEGLDVDMVPCFRIKSTESLRSAVDRTPFHTEFIKSHLTDGQKNQVRLLKKFMKGIGTYGAEQDARGFSGYLCELLVVHYGSFRGVLEGTQSWREGYSIAVDGKGPAMVSPLVVYDPVDPRRNVASAVHIDTMSLFMFAAKSYLANPRAEFFFPNPRKAMTREELEGAARDHGTRLISVSFRRPDVIEDSLFSQLWKTQYALARKLNDFSFNVLRAVHDMDDSHLTIVFEVERDMQTKTFKHRGPPVWVKSSENFLNKWRDNEYGRPFIEEGSWTVIAERMYFTAKEMLTDEAAIAGIGRELDPKTMVVHDHRETLSSVDPALVTELLDPRLPWEN